MSQDSLQFQPPYRLIRDGLNQGLVIPFLGSGASLYRNAPPASGPGQAEEYIPSAAELANYLAHKSEFPQEESKELAKVAQYYSLIGGRSPLYRELHTIFDRDFPLSPLHDFLASIEKPMLIVTTNYDDLIERAFLKRGKAFDLVVHTSDPDMGDRLLWVEHGSHEPVLANPNKLDIDLEKVSVIYKMHGAVDRQMPDRDQYVITEDDYVDFLVRMIKNKAVPAIFAEPFQSRHFLFLGYSLRDWNLRVILSRIQSNARQASSITSWGIQYNPSKLERKFWQKRGVELYDMPILDFVQEMTARAGDSL